MRKQGQKWLSTVLAVLVLFGLFVNAGFTTYADETALSAKGLDGGELLTTGSETDPWTVCVNFGPVSKPLEDASGLTPPLRIERANVTVSSEKIKNVKLKLGKYWTYNESNHLYEDPKNGKAMFELVGSNGSPAGIGWEQDSGGYTVSWTLELDDSSKEYAFYIIPNMKVMNNDSEIQAGKRYRQAITVTPVAPATIPQGDEDIYKTSFTLYVDMNVEAVKSDSMKSIKFSSPVKANRKTIFLSRDCADRLLNTLTNIENIDPRITAVDPSTPTEFNINVDGDTAGKPDVIVKFYRANSSGDIEYATVSQHDDCTVTKDSYELDPYEYDTSGQLSLYYNTLTFNFEDKHTHTYHSSTEEEVEGQVEWTWTGDEKNGYSAEVALYCTDSNCPDHDGSKQTVKATVTETVLKKETCTRSLQKGWIATATYGDITYKNVKKGTFDDDLDEHEWEFEKDADKVVWIGSDTEGYTAASIIKECKNDKHDTDVDGKKKITLEVPVTVTRIVAKCGEYNKIVYTAVFDSSVDRDIIEPLVFKKEVIGELVLHKWKVKYVTSNGDYNTAPTKAQLHLVCENDSSHTEIVNVSDEENITLVSETEKSKIYKYVGKTSDGQKVEGTEELVLDHNEHNWTVEFNWDYDKTNREVKSVTAVAICSIGKEQKTLEVELTSKEVRNTKQYTASTEDPSGKKWTSTKYIDNNTGELLDGVAAIVAGNSSIMIYGVEETYPFTGTRIKPVVVVMDGDKVLALSTEYTVSYKGKNKIGAINTVEVKGKGNYAGTSATAKFTIVDPLLMAEKEELAGRVKSVRASNDGLVYNGKAQYPSTVTVKTDVGDIEYTVDKEGNYSTTSDKKVVLIFSNNVNKGSAVVSAVGLDGKVKKKTYKIKAAEIAGAEFKIDEVTWGVKTETPEITATFNGMELVAGQDFKVSLKAKTAGDTAGTAKISGKGNFKGKHSDITYKVNPLKITEKNVVVKALAGKKAKDVKVTVNDNMGNLINKKKYSVEIQNAEGNTLGKSDALDGEIRVIIKASGDVITDSNGVAIVVNVGSDIAKIKGAFKVSRNFCKYYTGEPIELDEDDFGPDEIVINDLVYGKDFKIVSYKNNVKKGNMTVTIQGIGSYSGTRTFKVKIKPRPLNEDVPEN
ncbi:MAG: hypothetical protein IJI83_07335 [Oscillospiraceae bacterium]|nr:hypothetical protein [Oscillospiraceae bacterium]MBQ6493749.1 hypothetical protein [Erysipelotrichaceae bacterium]